MKSRVTCFLVHTSGAHGFSYICDLSQIRPTVSESYLLFLLFGLSLSARLRDAKETLDTENPRGRTPEVQQRDRSGYKEQRSVTVIFEQHAFVDMAVCCSPVALTGGVDDSITSRWMDLGLGFFLRLPDRGLMTSSMSSISLSCFFLRYSFLM